MTARDKFIVVALLTLMVVVSVVTIAMDTREARVVPAYGGTYVEGVTGVPQYLNPVIAATDVDQDIARLVFSGLTRFDRDGAIVADLASTFRTEAEGKVWTFEIRPDAIWHDGQDVTADDVVYTVKLLQDRAYVGPYADAFRGVTVERVGAKTVRFTLPDVYGPFAASTTVPILPSHILGGVPYGELARQQFNVHPIGTGPFRVMDVDLRQIVLGRNEDFYRTRPARPRPYLERVILRFYPDPSEALRALARGEIDGVAGLSTGDADGIREKGGVKLAFGISTSGEPSRVAAARQIASDLNAIGMKVEVHSQPFAELVEATARQRTFDALLVGISVSGDPDPYSFFHSTEASDPGHNFSGYSTLPIDRNLEAARRTIDEGARRELYAPIFRTIADEVPVVYLYFSDYLYAQDRTVQGLRIAPLTDPRERFWNVEDWYVRTQPKR